MTTSRTKPRQTEREFMDGVVQLAQLCGWLVHHCRPGKTQGGRWATQIQGAPGFPDLVLARRGRVLFRELKLDGEQPTPSQLVWLDSVGGHVWRPSDWETIKRELR